MPDAIVDNHRVLLVESGAADTSQLERRVRALGVESVRVASLEEAHELLAERRMIVTAVLLPTDLATDSLKKSLKRIRKAGSDPGILFVSTGSAPPHDVRKKLRAAGVKIALWDPIDDGLLRFQLNRAMSGDRDHHHRRRPRVPTYLLARIKLGERMKDAVVYSLSSAGAFLETPRASMEGADLALQIQLPRHDLAIPATVVYSNVPGNLQRSNLPIGNGVRFAEVSPEDEKAIDRYVDERLGKLTV